MKVLLTEKACSHFLSKGPSKTMHIDTFFNVSISMIMIDVVKCQMRNYQNSDTRFVLISNPFISNTRLNFAKSQTKAKQHSEAELLLFENYSLSLSTLSSKNN